MKKTIYALLVLCIALLACQSTFTITPQPAPAAAVMVAAPLPTAATAPTDAPPAVITVTTLDELRIRAEPSTLADEVGALAIGQAVEVDDFALFVEGDTVCNHWYKLTYRAGWICAEWTNGAWR